MVIAGAGPLVDVRLVLARNPWRIGPAWAVLGGALAVGAPLWGDGSLLRLLAAILLAELAWGAFFRLCLAGGSSAETTRAVLPYAQPGAPVAQLAGALAGRAVDGALRPGWYDLGVGLLLAGVLGAVLGRTALLLSGVALLLGLGAWLLASRGAPAVFFAALMGVALPWMLGVGLAGDAMQRPGMPAWGVLLMGTAFALLKWGALRAGAPDGRRHGVLWVGQAAVIAVGMALHLPWLVAIIGGLFLAPALRLGRHTETPEGLINRMEQCEPWWWAAMLVASIALRFWA
jgi:hypothetical protein